MRLHFSPLYFHKIFFSFFKSLLLEKKIPSDFTPSTSRKTFCKITASHLGLIQGSLYCCLQPLLKCCKYSLLTREHLIYLTEPVRQGGVRWSPGLFVGVLLSLYYEEQLMLVCPHNLDPVSWETSIHCLLWKNWNSLSHCHWREDFSNTPKVMELKA